MKLYYKPGACPLASHIVLHEVGADFQIELVDLENGLTASGLDYGKINPKGYVPALELASGEILTEGPSILQYIADQYPESGLTPEVGTIDRARLHEHLNYIGSEVHKAFSSLFISTSSDEDKKQAVLSVGRKFDYLNDLLNDGREFLLGDTFSVADAYLFVVSNWSNFVGIDLSDWPRLAEFVKRVADRPSTQSAMKAEGLIS